MTNSLATETLQQFRIIIGATRSHFRSLEKACGISGAQIWILSAIEASPGITVSALSQNLSVHVSTASNMLNKLAKAGLVKRLRNEEDRRVVTLHLTAKGQTILNRAPKPLTGLVPYALDKLQKKTLTSLNRDLKLLIKEMNYADNDSANKPLSDLIG